MNHIQDDPGNRPPAISIAPLGFTGWLAGQQDRNDLIGDLAREVAQDTCWPSGPGTLKQLEGHLTHRHVAHCGVIDALREAWAEYTAGQTSGRS